MKLYCLSRNNIYQTASSDYTYVLRLKSCYPRVGRKGSCMETDFDLPCMDMLIDVQMYFIPRSRAHISHRGDSVNFFEYGNSYFVGTTSKDKNRF